MKPSDSVARHGRLWADVVDRVAKIDLPWIENAYAFAARCHEGTYRHSGDPYITHSVEVASIVAAIDPSWPMVCAALLHDVVDVGVGFDQLACHFGAEVATLVTSLPTTDWRATEIDSRLCLLKLADRLHNARTWQWTPLPKAAIRAAETLQVFTALAARIGLPEMGAELDALSRGKLKEAEHLRYTTFRAAVRLLPEHERPRYAAEWAADLCSIDSRRIRRAARRGMAMAALKIRLAERSERAAA
jgi:(p)ppGpp synthase/HD superfamily hydrolase